MQRTRLDSILLLRQGYSGAKLIELDNQAKRQTAAIQGYRQDLLTRGLTPPQIDAVAEGRFVSTIEVVAPPPRFLSNNQDATTTYPSPRYEVQELRVDLGQQVQAGQLLSMLSNHQDLYIEGSAFKRESTLLAKVAENSWPVQAEFSDDDGSPWQDIGTPLTIRHLANSLDLQSRTLSFFVPLENQSRSYEKDGQVFAVWRFRPGQRVRLHIPVEEMQNVLVLPARLLSEKDLKHMCFSKTETSSSHFRKRAPSGPTECSDCNDGSVTLVCISPKVLLPRSIEF